MTSTTPKTSMPSFPGERESFWSSKVGGAAGVAVAIVIPRMVSGLESANRAKVRNYTQVLLRECEKAVLGSQFSVKTARHIALGTKPRGPEAEARSPIAD